METLRGKQSTNSPEGLSGGEIDPRLGPILELYGHVLVINHQGQPQSLSQAVDECPPLANILMNAKTPELLQQIIDTQKASEQG